ncbi:hypothetical protein PSA7680_00259 [Pseudoruegeria aquimaris]|uniref:Uncharacterized protein n=1 Tax=Pseudoruegeria aquimaris TaxID=393663 RepID=A0A1Y5RCB3_9RHOB|nr:hypothetical protein [Pseudoruegeria aquimaris]SLN13291.1 hypothetical protein PSA7680_00259 [Pseudoruegeria aquimaris]
MPVDLFDDQTAGLESPPTRIFEITPDDGTDLPFVTRALNAATSGEVRITTLGGDTATLYVAAGAVIPIRASRVWATGTVASGLRGLL